MTTNRVPARTITNSSSVGGDYLPDWTPVRPDGAQHEAIPSRRADGLVYRSGHIETLPESSGDIAGYGGEL